jgi:hypothetical protein
VAPVGLCAVTMRHPGIPSKFFRPGGRWPTARKVAMGLMWHARPADLARAARHGPEGGYGVDVARRNEARWRHRRGGRRVRRASFVRKGIGGSVLSGEIHAKTSRGAGLGSGSEKNHYRYLGRLPITARSARTLRPAVRAGLSLFGVIISDNWSFLRSIHSIGSRKNIYRTQCVRRSAGVAASTLTHLPRQIAEGGPFADKLYPEQ